MTWLVILKAIEMFWWLIALGIFIGVIAIRARVADLRRKRQRLKRMDEV